MISHTHKFFQNKDCPFYPYAGNGNACHPESDPSTHNCLLCFCPLYYLPMEKCPEGADPKETKDGIKDCSDCLYPHKPDNYDEIMEILEDINNNGLDF